MVSPDGTPSSSPSKCVIVDIGGKNCRIGNSDFEKPLMECLSWEKKEIYSIQETGALNCNAYYEPILQRGIITNWNFVEKQIKEFLNQQNIDSSKTAAIFTQSIAATDDDKEKVMHVLFEKLGFHSICTISDAFLSFITTGKSTGIIIQIGHSITEIIPIINREPLLQYATYFKTSGFDISSELSSEINSYTFPSSNLPLKRDEIKEKMCYVPRDSTKELSKYNKNAKALPPMLLARRRSGTGNAFKRIEQQKSQYSSRIYFEIAEIWFGNDFVKIISEMISKVPLQYQDSMYANIVLAGGTAQMKGFKERFIHEMVKKLPNTTSFNVTLARGDIGDPTNPGSADISNSALASFRGGVILAKNPGFSKLLTKRDEYSPDQFRRNQMIRTSKRIKNTSLLLSS